MNQLPACMGGWSCPHRDRCGHHLTEDRATVSERLCEVGAELPVAVFGPDSYPDVTALLEERRERVNP